MVAGSDGPKNWTDSLGKVVNGKPLDVVSWTGSVITVAPGYHRLKNALGLSVGLYLGRKLMNIVVGAKPNGDKIERESVPFPLRPLHGILSYNHFSDEPKDRWMKVLDNVTPAVFGALGAMAGSYHFFHDRYKTYENPTTIDDFEEAMSLQQSRPWSVISAISSLMGSSSGLSMGPIGNYGASLGTRFSLASGRKMALPGLGKFFSNNHSTYPYGPVQLIERMIHYAAGNPSENPEQLDAMAHGILGPWFKNVTQEQIQSFVGVVKGVRDNFLAEGGIPEEAQAKVKELLHEHFRHEGLEETLRTIGLDPTEATLGDNGFSTVIAKLLGKSGKMATMAADFVSKYHERQNGGPETGR